MMVVFAGGASGEQKPMLFKVMRDVSEKGALALTVCKSLGALARAVWLEQ